jgi:hypothetical protein
MGIGDGDPDAGRRRMDPWIDFRVPDIKEGEEEYC